jgi:hypothetical protein
LKLENIHVGDFVRCRSKYHRNQLGISEDPGLVIEIKRSNSKVLYPGDKRVWLPREMIIRVGVEPDYAPLLQKLNYLLKRVHAHECEFAAGAKIHRLSVQIDEIDAAAVDEVRSFLGNEFISLRIVPEGMAFMQIEIIFAANSSQPPNTTVA